MVCHFLASSFQSPITDFSTTSCPHLHDTSPPSKTNIHQELFNNPHQTPEKPARASIPCPLPDSTHASLSFGISSVRPALFTTIQQKPRLSIAHVSASHRHRLFVCFSRGKPSALAPSPVANLRFAHALSPFGPLGFCDHKAAAGAARRRRERLEIGRASCRERV